MSSPSDTEYMRQLDFPVLKSKVVTSAASIIGLQWLTHCKSSHPKCNDVRLLARGWYPTRLLDIGKEDSTSWRLCVTSEDEISPPSALYLTLSYRWSLSPQIRLLSSNIGSFRQGQPTANLPILFRDVIDIARQFSIRYVWIDALCIIQDSKADWEKEAPTMRHVYSNSAFTIAASGSESPNDTLFHDRNLDFIRPGKVHCSLFSDEPRPFYIYDKSYWDRQIFEGPLHNRGWVFQERFLSPRVLYFGQHQLLWECRTLHRCEVFPERIPCHWSDKEMDALIESEDNYDGQMTMRTFGLWNDLVEQYSNCDLTLPCDKLHAMAGIAKLFEAFTGDEYLAGLWKSRFVDMLDWRVFSPEPRRSLEYRAPSWSWASIDGPVRPRGSSSRAKLLVELVKAAVVNQTSDRMSTVLSAVAVLRARVIPAVCRTVTTPFATILAPTGEFTVQLFPDTTDLQFIVGYQLSYLPLKLDYVYGSTGESRPYIVCLILKQDTQSSKLPSRYRRLGHFVFDEACGYDIESAYFSTEIREIEVI
jgi:hypothetical protein